MANTAIITMTTNEAGGGAFTSDNPTLGLNKLANHCVALASGNKTGTTVISYNNGNAVRATNTITWTGASTNNDTIVVNGVTFTAKTSGATGNQWNIGSSASTAAANFASAYNSSTSGTLVSANALSGVVTLTAKTYGTVGNGYTASDGTDSGSVVTVGAAAFSGGANDSATYSYNVVTA